MDEMFDKIKEQAYKAKDGAVNVAKTVLDKTNSLVSKTKIKFAINETQGKIDDLYLEMGKKVYKHYKATGETAESMEETCAVIDALEDEILALKHQMAEIDEGIICGVCGAGNREDDIYCSKCGHKLFDDDEEDCDDDAVNVIPQDVEYDD